jgi:hypothetical protein
MNPDDFLEECMAPYKGVDVDSEISAKINECVNKKFRVMEKRIELDERLKLEGYDENKRKKRIEEIIDFLMGKKYFD